MHVHQARYLQCIQNAGEAKKDKAAVESDLSHATLKAPGISASSSGAITKDDPARQEGAWNQTVGSAKETVGNLVGSEVCSYLEYMREAMDDANICIATKT